MEKDPHKIFPATVIYCQPEVPGSSVVKIKFHLDSDHFQARAGQFVTLPPIDRTTVAPRPFTIVSYHDHVLTLLINVIGTNTHRYADLEPGDQIEIFGPYGTEISFTNACTSCMLVGGGIGNAALTLLAQKALADRTMSVTVLLGARDENMIPAYSIFDKMSLSKLETISEYGTTRTGYVTQLLHTALSTDSGRSTVVACGPKIMLRKVYELCELFGNPCIVIVEEIMVCGMGACKGCAIFGGIDGTEVRHVCCDGPAFDARWIDWDKFAPHTRIQVNTPRQQPIDRDTIDTSCTLCGIPLTTPFLNCSGTLDLEACRDGSMDLTGLGAFVIKGLSLKPRSGNPAPRVCETPSGMLNAIGLEYIGVEAFISNVLPHLRDLDIPIIANINGTSVSEYIALTELLNDTAISMIEVNISCPNVKDGGMIFGSDPYLAAKVTNAVKMVSRFPVIVKLTPNVTDIVSIARAVHDSGADAISLINTLLGTAIDVWNRKPRIANIVAGLSGPAIRPVALRCVMQVANAVKIPIIGMGGNENGYTAAEFMMAGAMVTAFGTSGFANRTIFPRAIDQLREVAHHHGYSATRELVASLITPS